MIDLRNSFTSFLSSVYKGQGNFIFHNMFAFCYNRNLDKILIISAVNTLSHWVKYKILIVSGI